MSPSSAFCLIAAANALPSFSSSSRSRVFFCFVPGFSPAGFPLSPLRNLPSDPRITLSSTSRDRFPLLVMEDLHFQPARTSLNERAPSDHTSDDRALPRVHARRGYHAGIPAGLRQRDERTTEAVSASCEDCDLRVGRHLECTMRR